MKYLIYLLLFCYCVNAQNADTRYIQGFLDHPTAYKSPTGTYKIDKTLVWDVNKQIDWGNTILVPTDSIDILYIRAKEWDCFNLKIDASELKYVMPTKTMITLQYQGSIMIHNRLMNTKLIGYDRSNGVVRRPNVNITKGYGYKGIRSDGKTITGNTTGSNNKGSIHNITFDVYFDGLHTGLELIHEGLPNSNHKIFLEGRNLKRMAYINNVNSNEIKYFYNNSLTLIDDEKSYELFDLQSSSNIVEFKFVDTFLMKKPQKMNYKWSGRITRTGHKWGLTNNGQDNTVTVRNRHYGNQFIKEIKKIDRLK